MQYHEYAAWVFTSNNKRLNDADIKTAIELFTSDLADSQSMCRNELPDDCDVDD